MLPDGLPWRCRPFPTGPESDTERLVRVTVPDLVLRVSLPPPGPRRARSPEICIYLSLEAVNSATTGRVWGALGLILYRLAVKPRTVRKESVMQYGPAVRRRKLGAELRA